MRVELIAYHDRTFKFKVKSPENSWFIRKAIGKEKCS
jgi:ribosomal protein L11